MHQFSSSSEVRLGVLAHDKFPLALVMALVSASALKSKAYPAIHRICRFSLKNREQCPSWALHLLDQLKRAATSVPLNIAEGSGKTSERDKCRFYSFARGSAMECVAILDALFHLKLVEPSIRDHSRTLLHSILAIVNSIFRKSLVL